MTSALLACRPNNRHHVGHVVQVRQLAPRIWMHTYHLPEIAPLARPGQFLHVRVHDGTAPLLRRPFSILRVDRDAGNVSILFKVFGTGTQILCGKRDGDPIDVLGPLGSSYTPPEGTGSLTLAGGGIGMVPLFFLSEELRRAGSSIRISYWFGARDREEIYLVEELRSLTDQLELVTEAGELGRAGRVPDYMDEWRETDAIFACGPNPMLRAIQRGTRDWPQPVHAAMESFMGCGLGACLGCVLETDAGYERVCTEGPVFDLRRLNLEEV